MNRGPADIAALLASVALRDRAAFSLLYSSTSAKLFGICLRVLKDRQEAEDALQEIYVKIWDKAGTFAANGYSPMSWLIAIARNHAIDRLRARKPEAADMEAAAEMPDQMPDPEVQAVNASEGRRIDSCLEELDSAKASAVRGAYVEGFSYQELADSFKVPVNTMRTWLRRSLMQLKDCLER